MKAIEKFDILFAELVPLDGPAETVAGEIIRAANKIVYRWYNDGEKIGIGYGVRTCSPADRYLMKKGGAKVRKTLLSWGDSDESYSKMISTLIKSVVEYVEANPALKSKPNFDDMDEYVMEHDFEDMNEGY